MPISSQPTRFAHLVHRTALALLMTCATLTSAMPPATDALLPAFVAEHINQPRLVGQGEFRWFGFRIYRARLWASNGQVDHDDPTSAPIALALTYERTLSGKQIAERSASEMAKLGIADEATRAKWLRMMEQVFPDVVASDTLAAVLDAQKQTRFFRNDEPLGSIADPGFGPAFLSIWLDRRTSAPKLRAALLHTGQTRALPGHEPGATSAQ